MTQRIGPRPSIKPQKFHRRKALLVKNTRISRPPYDKDNLSHEKEWPWLQRTASLRTVEIRFEALYVRKALKTPKRRTREG